MKSKFLIFLQLLRRSLAETGRNDPLRMAGATAFFTTFAIPPILIILVQVFTLFLDRKLVGTELARLLNDTLGNDVAGEIRRTARGFRSLVEHWYTAIPGFLFLLFVATTLFTVVKNTLDDIWKIRVNEKPGVWFYLKLRARSVAVILSAGLLFFVGIFIDSFEILAGENIEKLWPGRGLFFKTLLNELVGIGIVTIWFMVLFRYLADGRPGWKAVKVGGLLTGILFAAGKTLLSFLIKHSNAGLIYGASASFVLILLFVFYSSFILYYGAAFIKVYSEHNGLPIQPHPQAHRFRVLEID